jgi:hypothetical protein
MPTEVQPNFLPNKENEGKSEHNPPWTGDLRLGVQEVGTGS